MTSIGFHPTYGNGNKLTVVADKFSARNGSRWIEIKILEGTREIGEVVVHDATSIEVLETVD